MNNDEEENENINEKFVQKMNDENEDDEKEKKTSRLND
jgi:hypothetical protein